MTHSINTPITWSLEPPVCTVSPYGTLLTPRLCQYRSVGPLLAHAGGIASVSTSRDLRRRPVTSTRPACPARSLPAGGPVERFRVTLLPYQIRRSHSGRAMCLPSKQRRRVMRGSRVIAEAGGGGGGGGGRGGGIEGRRGAGEVEREVC